METETHYHIEETRSDGIVTGVIVPDIDTWQADEIDQLREDLEEAEVARDIAEDREALWHRKYEADHKTLKEAVRDAKHGASKLNLNLTDKLMIYLDLINEYEKALDTYVVHTGVKLTTNNLKKLLELKSKGDLIPNEI